MPFPPLPFDGLVSTHDECDDGIHLRRELSGKRWDELSPEVLFHGSIGLPLLEPSALIAFLPAWLLRSMETRDVDDPLSWSSRCIFFARETRMTVGTRKVLSRPSDSSIPANETQWLISYASS
jgi:hypothetical protein